MYARPTAPRSIGGVLDDAIKLYRESFARCWLIALLCSIVRTAAGIYVAVQVRGVTIQGRGVNAAVGVLQSLDRYKSSDVWGTNLLIAVMSLLAYSAIVVQQDATVRGVAQAPTGQALAIALRRLPGSVIAALSWIIGITVGLILLVIPGVYLWGRWQLWITAMFVDDAGAFESLSRSWNLTQGYWWRSVTILSVALIIIIVLSLIGSVVAGMVAGVTAVTSTFDVGNVLIGTQIVDLVVTVFVLPMFPAALLATYYDLKMRREGGDLAARLSSLQSA